MLLAWLVNSFEKQILRQVCLLYVYHTYNYLRTLDI